MNPLSLLTSPDAVEAAMAECDLQGRDEFLKLYRATLTHSESECCTCQFLGYWSTTLFVLIVLEITSNQQLCLIQLGRC